MSAETIAGKTERIRTRIAEACRRAGRSESEVALMAVSKMHPASAIAEAHAAGLRLFGENRVQEWHEKSQALPPLSGLEVHLIGPLQSNKTARAAELFHAVDSVDSLKVATRLNAAAAALGKKLPILIEVKLSHEPSKHGIPPAGLPALLDQLAPLGSLVPAGLMTVPPWSEQAESARPYFRQLRRLRDAALAAHPNLTQLSIGMSNDFAVAIEEGSTCIRIGTALFGRRKDPQQGSAG
ncbi:MAG TPA: YggS family pyridoxal phosphate-dependent enzyme [Acidobacteriaceae bacterium]|nr:YggS family pyridoxal phosphate-dependent enzyme [Acidobacteriaceae bacterium]